MPRPHPPTALPLFSRRKLLVGGVGAFAAQRVVSQQGPSTRAVQRATRTLPVVTSVGDPVGLGYAQSLARPGGNITGLS